jgi:hypothetical protein
MMFSGIDLHKRRLSIHTLDEDGELVRWVSLAATPGRTVERGDCPAGHDCLDTAPRKPPPRPAR